MKHEICITSKSTMDLPVLINAKYRFVKNGSDLAYVTMISRVLYIINKK